ncbi:beta strand repeat-containing protein [Nostoc sp.]|uniref:beta strand repeat-containing protein n=1 Tax=Nostoc sp. TaxID=1180 RepID=UPI002FF53C57
MVYSSLNLSDLNGSNGFTINGIAGDASGESVSSAGDVNDDGITDLIIGAPDASPNGFQSGRSYVVFGKRTGFSPTFNLSSLNGANGFTINGIAGDNLGISVSSAGDVNDDGITDLIIGAYGASPNSYRSGQSYVVFGKSTGFSPTLNLSDLNGANGFTINGIAGKNSSYSVSSAGDVNGDGIADLIIGGYGFDPNGDYSGRSYVVFGKSTGFSPTLNLSDLNGANGFAINGIAGDGSGESVSSAGDVNDDGITDLIIGASGASPNGFQSGRSYVVFGKSTGFSPTFNLLDLNGANGFAINGIKKEDYSGESVSSAGDVNGDGIADLIIGASGADPNGYDSGQSYVVFGRSTGFSPTFNLLDLNGANGFAINGIKSGDNSGISVSSAGDVNSDGITDLIIGTPNADPNGYDSGQSYVVFGKSTGFSPTFNLLNLNGANGFAINGIVGSGSGFPVSSAGDVNGDGIADLIIGAPNVYLNGDSSPSGQSYVVFGGKNIGRGSTNNLTGTAGTDTLVRTSGNNIIDGKAGNDTLTGNGGQDKFIIRPGDGNDIITDFAGVGKGSNPLEAVTLKAAVINNVDTLQFTGNGLTAQNLQLTENGNNLEVTFENVASTKVTLQNFLLENLDNLPANSSREAIGNILFDGQTRIADSFDVINANSTQTRIFNKNTVTFLNDLNNNIVGFDNSNDVINGQGGNDIINGLSGNDLLRGGSGDDILIGGEGNDTLVGGVGNDILVGGIGADRFLYNTDAAFDLTAVGVDTISDFNCCQGDKIVLDKTTFSAITSGAGTGFNNLSDFQVTNSPETSTAKIVYDGVSGQLFYNENGDAAGFGSGGLFATLTGAPTLTACDFVLQA